MADFTSLILEGNHGTQGTPVWVEVGPTANKEVRWSDSSTQNGIASASWPAMIRPASVDMVDYTYAYTADATGFGFISGQASPCPTWARSNYQWARWSWDNTSSFASAPIFTAYPTTGHGSISRNDGSLLGGSTDTDDSGTKRSYLKGNAYGQVGAPSGAPSQDPTVTDGTTGSVNPSAGGNWLSEWQGLMGDSDYITAPFTPTGTTAGVWHVHFALFTGPNMTPATYTVVMTLKYTWT